MSKDWLLIIPTFFMVGFFLIVPAVLTVYYSFTNYSVGSEYLITGLQNYIQFFKDPISCTALLNNLKFMLLNLIISLPVGLLVAVLAYKVAHNTVKTLMKLTFYLVISLPLAGAGTIYLWIFQPVGPLNLLLRSIGLETLAFNWLGDPSYAVFAPIITSIWILIAYVFIFTYTGLVSIPRMYEEAATIDGAGELEKLIYIRLPLLRPSIGVSIYMIIVTSLRMFDLIAIMTRGGPYRSSEVLAHYFYREAFYTYNFGYAAAMGVILFLLTIIIVLPYVMYLFKREVQYGVRG